MNDLTPEWKMEASSGLKHIWQKYEAPVVVAAPVPRMDDSFVFDDEEERDTVAQCTWRETGSEDETE